MTLRLLVVDDSALIRQRLLEMLEGIVGIETRASAATLDEALLCARRDLSTVVLLDLNFPEGNALSIIPTLKRLPSTPQIAVLTNDARASTRRQCLQAGADWFFDKSTEFQIAIELVHTQAALN
jgi:DNA-binding NarL/FixJ family response regulator